MLGNQPLRLVRTLVLVAATSSCCPQPTTRPALGPSASKPRSGASASPSTTAAPLAAAATVPNGNGNGNGNGDVERCAHAQTSRAAAAEPDVTTTMIRLAGEHRATMVKLKYRLKTLKSTRRKLRKRSADEGLPCENIELTDALRYTMAIPDDPPGHYLTTVRTVVLSLEAQKNEVRVLKNYWPRRDSYSGINSVFRLPTGQLYELQFHTPASAAAQASTRDQYEELRRDDTPLPRKRQLFDAMTKVWDAVPVPVGILEPHAIHEREEIRLREHP